MIEPLLVSRFLWLSCRAHDSLANHFVSDVRRPLRSWSGRCRYDAAFSARWYVAFQRVQFRRTYGFESCPLKVGVDPAAKGFPLPSLTLKVDIGCTLRGFPGLFHEL